MTLRLVTAAGDVRTLPRSGDAAARTIEVGAGMFHAGLVNVHDHLHRNHYGRLGSPPYADAYEWGRHIHDQFAPEIAAARQLARPDALLFGALKNIIAGVTTVVHHDSWEPMFQEQFPLRVLPVPSLHSPGLETEIPALDRIRGLRQPWCMHIAEGTSARARTEVRWLREHHLLNAELLAVHGVGLGQADVAALADAGAALVWCPTSNQFLFGCTAPGYALRAMDVLLGSDSLLTADGTLLDELRVARNLGVLDDARLLAAVTTLARRRLRQPTTGCPDDLVLFRRPVLDASPADVALVVVAGRPVLADATCAAVFECSGVSAQALCVGGEWKWVASPLADVAARVCALTPAARRAFA